MKPHALFGAALLVVALALSNGLARAGLPFKTISVPGAAGSAVVHRGQGKLYVVDGGGVAIVDTSALVIADRIPTAPGSLLLDEPNDRLYVLHASGASGSIDVIDTSTDAYLTTIALPGTFYQSMAYNALARRLYVTSDFDVAVVDTTLNQVVSTAAGGPSDRRALCINAATNRIYVVNSYQNNVTVIDGATNTQMPGSPVAVGERPWTCVVDAIRNRVIVTNYFSATLSVIDGATNAITATVPVSGGSLSAIADDTLNLLAVGGDRTVSFFRLDTLALIKEVRTYDQPASFMFDALGLALIANPDYPNGRPAVIELRRFTDVTTALSSNGHTLIPYRNRCFLFGSAIDVYKCPSFRREWDTNNDGHSDLAWYNAATKENGLSLMNGATTIDSAITLGPSDWVPVLRSDLDGDGYGDLVFRNTTTQETAAWFMKGLAPRADGAAVILGRSTYVPIFAVECGYAVAHCLVWRDTVSGKVAYWYMPTGPVPDYAQVIYDGDPGWTPVLTGDFDGDDHTDLLWRHTDGRVALWLMQGDATGGFSAKASAVILGPGTGWVPKFVADFDGDGLADIVWQNATTGSTAAWMMDGLQTKPGGARTIMDGASGWTPTRAESDSPWGNWLIWRHVDGSTAASNVGPGSFGYLILTDPNWSVTHAGRFDSSANWNSHLIWYNNVTGQTAMWTGIIYPSSVPAFLSHDPRWRVVPNN